MGESSKAFLINFNKIGKSVEGYISIAEFKDKIPFEVKRAFWTYFTPDNITRGRHAHYKTEQVLIAVAGIIKVTIEKSNGEIENFLLDNPEKGLYVPPDAWHTMEYSHNAVQLVFASTNYDEKDYIRDYDHFKSYYK